MRVLLLEFVMCPALPTGHLQPGEGQARVAFQQLPVGGNGVPPQVFKTGKIQPA